MFATGGFFGDIVCPFFRSGLCERPNCLFKHELPPPPKAAPKYAAYTPTPLHKLKRKPSATESKSAVSKDEESSSSNRSVDVPEYTPTPISELKKRKLQPDEDVEAKKVKAEELSDDDEVQEVPVVKEIREIKVISIEDDEDDVIPPAPSKPTSPEKKAKSPEKPLKAVKVEVKSELKTIGEELTKKTRIAHQPSAPSKIVVKKKMTASEVMLNRYKIIENQALRSAPSSSSASEEESQPAGKKRLAHAAKPELLLNAAAKRPVMPLDIGSNSKVPIAIRKQYMNLFIDEFLKGASDPQEAFDKGLKEEKQLYDKCANRKLYSSLAANAIKRIRSELGTQKPQPTNVGGNKVISHEQILNGPRATNCSVEKRNKALKAEELPENELYSYLKKYLLTPEKMKSFGYPQIDPDQKGCAIVMSESKALNDFKSTKRICSRCKKTFAVNEKGAPIEKEPCSFHYGRLWNERSHGTFERKYSCCKMDMTAGGCSIADSHVVDGLGHPDFCKGYVCTKARKLQPNACHGVYALDCEMCNTTVGMELTRVSVIDSQFELVYETLVKPRNIILDYNTKFSGIKEEDLKGVKTRIEDVQKDLLKLFSDQSILIGHSLESDLKALKLIHPTVIDTADVFPHRRGLPFKRALRTLAAEFLQKIIQDDVAGHDSHEDAKSCMQLMLMKVNNDLAKRKGKNQ